jgi:hypothetical protein
LGYIVKLHPLFNLFFFACAAIGTVISDLHGGDKAAQLAYVATNAPLRILADAQEGRINATICNGDVVDRGDDQVGQFLWALEARVFDPLGGLSVAGNHEVSAGLRPETRAYWVGGCKDL